MNEQHIKGAVDKTKGAVKDAAGKAMGDKEMQAEGKMDKAKGAAHIIRVNHAVIGPMAAARRADLFEDSPGAQSCETDGWNSTENPAGGKHLAVPVLEYPIVALL